jgi:hypothetical protein
MKLNKARRRGALGQKRQEPNNLLDFMLQVGQRTRNLLLATATPIQTENMSCGFCCVFSMPVQILFWGVNFLAVGPDWEKKHPCSKWRSISHDDHDAWDGYVILFRLAKTMHCLQHFASNWVLRIRVSYRSWFWLTRFS